jgi:hypothetical protein
VKNKLSSSDVLDDFTRMGIVLIGEAIQASLPPPVIVFKGKFVVLGEGEIESPIAALLREVEIARTLNNVLEIFIVEGIVLLVLR